MQKSDKSQWRWEELIRWKQTLKAAHASLSCACSKFMIHVNNVCVSFAHNRVDSKTRAMLEMYTDTGLLNSTPQIHVTRHSLANLRKQVNSPGRRVHVARHVFNSGRRCAASNVRRPSSERTGLRCPRPHGGVSSRVLPVLLEPCLSSHHAAIHPFPFPS